MKKEKARNRNWYKRKKLKSYPDVEVESDEDGSRGMSIGSAAESRSSIDARSCDRVSARILSSPGSILVCLVLER